MGKIWAATLMTSLLSKDFIIRVIQITASGVYSSTCLQWHLLFIGPLPYADNVFNVQTVAVSFDYRSDDSALAIVRTTLVSVQYCMIKTGTIELWM